MRKFLTVSIPIVGIALFICIMLSGNILKKPFGNEESIPQAIKTIQQDVTNEDWDKVRQEIENLDKVWKKVVFRIQFSSERDEINYFTSNIARMRGAVQAKDKSSMLMELSEAYSHWEGLDR